MRSSIKRTAAVLAAAAVMTASFTSCAKNTETQNGDNPGSTSSDSPAKGGSDVLVKMTYKNEEITFPEELGDPCFYGKVGGNVCFLSMVNGDGETKKSKLFLSKEDETGSITETTELPLTPDDGSAYVYDGFIASDGTIYYVLNIFGESEDGQLQVCRYFKSVNPDGTENYSVDMSTLSKGFDPNMDYIYTNGICADGSGRAVICTNSCTYGFDASGKEIFALDESAVMNGANGYIRGTAASGSGDVYITYIKYDNATESYSTNAARVDFDGGKMSGDIVSAAGVYADYVFSGGGEYIMGYSAGSLIKGLKEDGSSDELINIANAGVDTSYVAAAYSVGDGSFSVWYNDESDHYRLKHNMVTKLDESEAKEKIKLSLSAVSVSNSLRSAVVNYNNSDGDYYIEITDYTADDFEEAKSKINAEISAGNVPDIISMDAGAIGEYAKKGLLIDLNQYIDGENGLDRSGYFDNIFRGMETNGKLYAITDAFVYTGFAAKKSIIPDDGAVSYADIERIRQEYEGINVFPPNAMTKSDFLEGAMIYGIQKFVNKDTNECSFNTPEFIKILELANEYPAEIDRDALAMDDNAEAEMQLQYVTNSTLFMPFSLSNYSNYGLWADGWFGEDISSSGFPGLEMEPVIEPISSIAISSQSAHPEAGWELIKYMLSDEIQEKVPFYFPVSKSAMKAVADKEIALYADYEEDVITYYVGGMTLEIKVPDQSLVDRVNGLIESTDNVAYYDSENINEIITDEANSYFSGASTAEKAAENIQNRVALYLSEQE